MKKERFHLSKADGFYKEEEMEIKSSKIFKIKNQKREEDTAKEREFRNAVMKEARYGKDEKIILSFAMVLLLVISIFVEQEAGKAVAGVLMFLTGMAGIIR